MGRLDEAVSAALEAHDEGGVVVDVDWTFLQVRADHRARRRSEGGDDRPLLDVSVRQATDLGNLTNKKAGEIDHVTADVAERACAGERFLEAPGQRNIRAHRPAPQPPAPEIED